MSAVDLFEEVSNAPASFTSIRCALATSILKKFDVEVRDALQAYLQARIDSAGRTETWCEIPREWWPDEWFVDGAKRQVPRFNRPVCKLVLALYGHPESGALWENKLKGILEGLSLIHI